MAEQYFTSQPTTDHAYQNFTFNLRQQELQFTTDSGVFSKQTVDYGTRALLAAMDLSNLPEGALLDLGCGYGPIGLTLAKETQRQVTMVDVNERAVALAQKNATANRINNVHISISDIYQQVVTTDFAAIYINPPIRAGKKVITTMLTQAPQHLQKGGQLWIVVQKKQGASSYQKIMQQAFGNATIVARDKGYYVIQSVKNHD
ncbi:class I SAM-dependent methyltransferase [Bombilactobacillus thymidiniphilus]|uniref:Class I SAM-dependent methyltransferase n=1 Tax=Bombilactobacillus thymidiniphilus TaxID=2923363 RepID=A0ABY4PF46_9LACO|nr:class I SAM-dependent methyltransferase [Bombilactobacillus thymidiniphilus]UQS84329.1 class I SAM-dependent methyltransferase [Bombilactobacillus thymidiniphilus]